MMHFQVDEQTILILAWSQLPMHILVFSGLRSVWFSYCNEIDPNLIPKIAKIHLMKYVRSIGTGKITGISVIGARRTSETNLRNKKDLSKLQKKILLH